MQIEHQISPGFFVPFLSSGSDPLAVWYRSLTTADGRSCCSMHDCAPAEARLKEGRWEVLIFPYNADDAPGSPYRITQSCGARTRTGGLSFAGHRMDLFIASCRRPAPECDGDRPGKANELVWQIDCKLQEDGARLIILPRRQLPRALHQGSDDHGQQQLQRLAFGRRLTQQVAAGARSTSASGTSPPIRGGE